MTQSTLLRMKHRKPAQRRTRWREPTSQAAMRVTSMAGHCSRSISDSIVMKVQTGALGCRSLRARKRKTPAWAGVLLLRRFSAAEARLELATATVQDRLGVAVGLLGAFEDQFQRGLEGNAVIEVRCHRAVGRVTGVLPINHLGHALHALDHLFPGDDAVAQPVGQQLAGDTQGGAVFHQADIIDVRYLGAANALIDPAYNVTQDALDVVVDLVLLLLGTPVGVLSQRNGQDVVHRGEGALGQFLLTLEHVDLVVVQGVQRGSSGGGYPGGVGTGHRVADLLLQHGGHQVRHGPHALADLGAAGQAEVQTVVDVPVLVGSNPLLGLHGSLAYHGAGLHGGMDLVTGTVEEAGVDEHHALAGRFDAGLEVDGGATLLVHDAHLQGVAGQAQQVFHPVEQLIGEGHFLGAVHLRLDDVHRAGAAVPAAGVALEVVDGNQAGDDTVHDAFGHFVAVLVEDGIVGHQVADVAHEQHGTAVQAQLAAVGGGVGAVRVHGPGEGAATLAHGFGQVALHQAQPVAVGQYLVVGVDGGNRVFTVHDGGQGGFHQHVLDPGGVGLADRAAAIDLDLEVQTVVPQQNGAGLSGITLVADELLRLGQTGLAAVLEADLQLAIDDGIGCRIAVGTFGQGRCLIKECAGIGNYLVAPYLVVARALLGATFFTDGVGAVQSIVQRPPTGVGGVEREAGVHDRHHQLGTGHGGDLFVHVLGGNLEVGRFRQQIADLLQEGLVGSGIMGLAGALLVPCVDLSLEVVTFFQQCAVFRCQIVNQRVHTVPEGGDVNASTGNGLLIDEVIKNPGNLEITNLDAITHENPSLFGETAPWRIRT